jgi:hypothetical protein
LRPSHVLSAQFLWKKISRSQPRLVAPGIRQDGQKVLLAVKNIGGEGDAHIAMPSGEGLRSINHFCHATIESVAVVRDFETAGGGMI